MGRQWCQEESCISLLVCLGTAYLLRWIMDHRRSFPDLEKEQNYNETTQDSEMEMGCKISSDGSIFVKRYEVVIVETKAGILSNFSYCGGGYINWEVLV